uniref:Uncharacterized protein n=1 Tax=Panagrolaimus sp. PS1159 TaxID=55785 RepID=A0AC35GWM8_9BILA
MVISDICCSNEGAKYKSVIQSAFASNDGTPVDEYWKSITSADVMDSKLRVIFSVAGSSETTQAPIGPSAVVPAKRTLQTTMAYSTASANGKFGLEVNQKNLLKPDTQVLFYGPSVAVPAKQPPGTIQTTKYYTTIYDNERI